MTDIDELAERVKGEVTLVLSTSSRLRRFELTYLLGHDLTNTERRQLTNRVRNHLHRLSRSDFGYVHVRTVSVPPEISGSLIIVTVSHTGNYVAFSDDPI